MRSTRPQDPCCQGFRKWRLASQDIANLVDVGSDEFLSERITSFEEIASRLKSVNDGLIATNCFNFYLVADNNNPGDDRG